MLSNMSFEGEAEDGNTKTVKTLNLMPENVARLLTLVHIFISLNDQFRLTSIIQL